MVPESPLYIVSKGRWQKERRFTNRVLEGMGVRHSIIVERQEADAYRSVVNSSITTILVLDPAYQHDYDACMELAPEQSRGSGPARNFAWEHSIGQGALSHWVMDDNIQAFFRLNKNLKIKVGSRAFFSAMEAFFARYSNLAMAGPAYEMFVPRKTKVPPFVLNTRIYSCNLIRNDVPFRWRGRYNEDTILSLDMLKAGWCTVEFNAFLQDKMATQTLKGGNTDEIYKGGTLDKSEMLVREHPDVSKVVWKYGRWHHLVDYRTFKYTQLQRRDDIQIAEGTNEYGMRLTNR